jgi:hypothetical protein
VSPILDGLSYHLFLYGENRGKVLFPRALCVMRRRARGSEGPGVNDDCTLGRSDTPAGRAPVYLAQNLAGGRSHGLGWGRIPDERAGVPGVRGEPPGEPRVTDVSRVRVSRARASCVLGSRNRDRGRRACNRNRDQACKSIKKISLKKRKKKFFTFFRCTDRRRVLVAPAPGPHPGR